MPKTAEKRISKETVKRKVLAIQQKAKEVIEEIEALKESYTGQHTYWDDVLDKIINPIKDEGLQNDLIFAENIVLGLPDVNYNKKLQDLAGYLDTEFNLLQSIWQLIREATATADEKTVKRNLKEAQELCNTIKTLITKSNNLVSETL